MSRVGTLLSIPRMADGKDKMITNVEGLNGRTRRQRIQQNMPITLSTQSLDFYLTSRHPEPGLGDAEPYNGAEILPTNEPDRPQQIIEYEKASSTDALAVSVRYLKSEKHRLQDEYRRDLHRYWQHLLSTKTIIKVFYKTHTVEVPVKAQWKRIFDGFTTVKKVVSLKPRLVPQYARVPVTTEWKGKVVQTGTRKVVTGLKLVTPRVVREVEWPSYRSVLIRPAGVRLKKVRAPSQVRVRDWVAIRSLYAEYKAAKLKALQKALQSISDRLSSLSTETQKRPPRHMASWTTHGYVRPYPVGQKPHESYAVSLPGRTPGWQHGNSHQPDFLVKAPQSGDPTWTKFNGYLLWTPGYVPRPHNPPPYGGITTEQIEWFGREHGFPSGGTTAVPALRRAQGDLRFVDGIDYEKQAMLAFSTVQSLTKAKDYQFQWFRSLVELKDGKQTLVTLRKTAKYGSGFLNWLAGTQRRYRSNWKDIQHLLKLYSKRFSSTLQTLAAAYLAWKFAIEPTISDVQTVITQTTDWLYEIRRALASILTDPNGPLNTYHARANYGDNARVLKLGSYLDIKVQDRDIEISVPCSVLWASALWTPLDVPYIGTQSNARHWHAVYDGPWEPYQPSGRMADPVGLKTTVYADNGIHEYEHTFEHAIMASHSYYQGLEPEGVKIPHGFLYSEGPSKLPDLADLERRICCDVFNQTPVVERVPIYATSWSSGVVFAEYRVQDLLALLSHPSGAMPGCSSLMSRIYDGAADLLTRIDLVKNAWELTPLSFIYDWFTDSGNLVTMLANAARSNWAVYNQTPQPLNGLWECRRSELLAGTPLYQVTGCDCVEYTTVLPLLGSWSGSGQVPELVPDVVADRSVRRYRLRLTCIDDKVHVMRTGLYRVRRGEQTGYDSIISYLPKLSVSIQGGKILSLSALITSLLGGEGR